MKWYYNGEVYDPAYEDIPEDVLGFVYIITDTESGEKYIGQKRMRKPKTLPITKSRKRRVRTVVESDWRSYHSSSAVIKENVAAGHTARYHREIIRFGGSKGDLNFLETKEQIDRNVLFDAEYLNGIINCKIHKKHISKKLRREFGYDN
jgi:hypothetical protein